MLFMNPELKTSSPAVKQNFPEDIQERKARAERVKNYLLILSRRSEADSTAAETIALVLGERIAEYWEPALDAAMKAAEHFEFAQAHPVIDAVIAKSLREKPDLNLIADLYNKIPLDTVLLKQTGLEVFRQTVKAMEDRNRVELHPAYYLTLLLNLTARLIQLDQWDEAETLAKKTLEFSRTKHVENPKEFYDVLAGSIESMAIILSAKGEHQRSKELREEAIRLLRDTSGHERDLAQSLNNYAGALKALGDDAGALTHSQEAVKLYRQLVEKAKPEGVANFSKGLDAWLEDPRPNLAKALIGLSSYQDQAKLHQDYKE